MTGKTLRYIAVEGPIGVGKTSLARRLSESFESDLILEHPEENPFLERFYRDPENAAFPAQLFFLFQRARQMQTFRQADLFQPVRISDYLLEKDRIFAQLTLDEAEFGLYEQIYDKLSIELPQPDLVIYLQAPLDVLLRRIASRGIGYEQQIDRAYLERVMEAYARFFHEYDRAPLLIVNASQIDLVRNERDYGELFSRIMSIRHGRHYYNPLSHEIA